MPRSKCRANLGAMSGAKVFYYPVLFSKIFSISRHPLSVENTSPYFNVILTIRIRKFVEKSLVRGTIITTLSYCVKPDACELYMVEFDNADFQYTGREHAFVMFKRPIV